MSTQEQSSKLIVAVHSIIKRRTGARNILIAKRARVATPDGLRKPRAVQGARPGLCALVRAAFRLVARHGVLAVREAGVPVPVGLVGLVAAQVLSVVLAQVVVWLLADGPRAAVQRAPDEPPRVQEGELGGRHLLEDPEAVLWRGLGRGLSCRRRRLSRSRSRRRAARPAGRPEGVATGADDGDV